MKGVADLFADRSLNTLLPSPLFFSVQRLIVSSRELEIG